MSRADWVRVNKRHPCPVCASPDWCIIAQDGTAAICARVESSKRVGEKGAGWLHRLTDVNVPRPKPVFRPAPPAPTRDWDRFSTQCIRELAGDEWRLAEVLGVSELSLCRLCCGWSHQHGAHTFPMRDADCRIIGIRTRYRTGTKLAVTGSRNGLFIPGDLDPTAPLWICEGPTDCAALITPGYSAIGRPSNTAGLDYLIPFVKRWKRRDVVIVADRDPIGSIAETLTLNGARRLASELAKINFRPKIIRPPGKKDVREWIGGGATRELLDCVVRSANPVWA